MPMPALLPPALPALVALLAAFASPLVCAERNAADPVRAAPPSPMTATAAADKFDEVIATPELLNKLRAGGYALYLRHGTTNNAIGDRVPMVDLNDCSTQRPLTDEGRQLMVKVGKALRKARIPIGELRVSPMCRARESAAAAFPAISAVVDPQLMYVSNFTDAEKAPIIANTRLRLSAPVPAGSNRLLLAHAPNLMELMGYFPKEGTLVIFRPRGDGQHADYLGSVPAQRWDALLQAMRP